MKIRTEQEVLVESIERPGLGLGEIIDIICDTEEAIIHIEWSNGTKGQYLAKELEFIVNKKY